MKMDKPIRVLQVVPNMQAGGLETLIMNLYRNIDRSKVQFDFLVHYKGQYFYDQEIKDLGGRIYHLSVREDNNILKYIKDLDNFFKNHTEYNVVHGHMVSTAIFYMYFAKKYGVKLRILHSHNTNTNTGIKGFTKAQLAKVAPHFANKYFACGEEAGKFLYKNKKFFIFNNGIDLNKFKFDSQIRKKYRHDLNIEDKLVIGHIGRFNMQKNHQFLIKIFNELQKIKTNSELLLIGDGELKNKIMDEVKELGLEEKVKFLGVREDTQNLYQAMDIFLLPSFFEGFPVVAVEAQDSGLPIIASSNITREINLTPQVSFYSLNRTPKEWADFILGNYNSNINRNNLDYYSKLQDAGFDIKKEAKRLQIFYEGFYS